METIERVLDGMKIEGARAQVSYIEQAFEDGKIEFIDALDICVGVLKNMPSYMCWDVCGFNSPEEYEAGFIQQFGECPDDDDDDEQMQEPNLYCAIVQIPDCYKNDTSILSDITKSCDDCVHYQFKNQATNSKYNVSFFYDSETMDDEDLWELVGMLKTGFVVICHEKDYERLEKAITDNTEIGWVYTTKVQ